MANPKLTNAKPLNFHLTSSTDDGVLTAANQISDVTRTTYKQDGSIDVLKTVQDTLDETIESVESKQDTIDSTHKLSSDLIDDTNKTNKFVTSEEKSTWNNKYTKPSSGIPDTDFTLLTQEKIERAGNAVTETLLNERLSEKQNILTEGDGIEISTDGVISAPNTLTNLEKLWVKTQVFNQYFTGSISPISGNKSVFDVTDNQIKFTLITKFNGVLQDLDSIPTGWDKTDGTYGTYTKTVEAGITGTASKAKAESGNVSCIFETLTKEISGSVVDIYKPAYVWITDKALPSDEEISAAVAAGQTIDFENSDSLIGSYTVSGCDGKYVHFILPAYATRTITGTDMKSTTEVLSNLTINSKQIGRYIYYSTSVPQTVDEITFTIS